MQPTWATLTLILLPQPPKCKITDRYYHPQLNIRLFFNIRQCYSLEEIHVKWVNKSETWERYKSSKYLSRP
jgi:hypothetical protein